MNLSAETQASAHPQPSASGTDRVVGCSSWLGTLFLALGEAADAIEIRLTETLDELNAIAHHVGHVDKDLHACCCWNYGAKGPLHGFLLFAREKLTRRLIVHEVTHAALLFVNHRVMRAPEVQAMDDQERSEYYEEAVAQITESLFAQADEMLLPNNPSEPRA
jgi:hypothetical protein